MQNTKGEKMAAPLSCLVPVYNAGKYLEESLESIRSQTFKEFEIFAYDDGSDDDSLQILNAFQKKEKRLKILSRAHSSGIPNTLNQLMQASKSKFFAFQGACDLSHPERFEKQMALMKNSSLVALGTSILVDGSQVEKENLKIAPKTFTKQVLEEQIAHYHQSALYYQSAVYSHSLLKKKIQFDETTQTFYDLIFNAEVQHHFPLRLSNCSEFLYTLRLYPGCLEEKRMQEKENPEVEQNKQLFISKLIPIYLRYITYSKISSVSNPY